MGIGWRLRRLCIRSLSMLDFDPDKNQNLLVAFHFEAFHGFIWNQRQKFPVDFEVPSSSGFVTH